MNNRFTKFSPGVDSPMTRSSFSRLVAVTLLAALPFSLTSCETPVGQGAAIGAGSGAVIGGLATNQVRGAATGALIGAAAGSLIGAAVQADESSHYGRRDPRDYPVANPTDRPGFVVSPYAPYYEIDVRGVPHGALVRDPSCNRLFVKP
jgi:hypothetical protein